VNLAVLLLGLFPSALAYLAWAYVLARVEVSRASIAMYLIPPIAMLLAALVLHERVHGAVIVGAAIVLGSVMAMQLEGRWAQRRSVLPGSIGTAPVHSGVRQNTLSRCPSGSRATKV